MIVSVHLALGDVLNVVGSLEGSLVAWCHCTRPLLALTKSMYAGLYVHGTKLEISRVHLIGLIATVPRQGCTSLTGLP